ncbi:MAG: hypothetical protein LBV67_08485 [Streptococcaceae bacterium]|nr:hypothetical protein [Streptococcaceae bacterium]
MKAEIRYQSRGGNTLAVAQEISKILNIPQAPIEEKLPDMVDLLFIGGGVYMFDIDKNMKKFLDSLSYEKVKAVAIFTTSGHINGTGKMADYLKDKGIDVLDSLSFKAGVRNYHLFGGQGTLKLTQDDKGIIQVFVDKVVGKVG